MEKNLNKITKEIETDTNTFKKQNQIFLGLVLITNLISLLTLI